MTGLFALIKRNTKLFFRDRGMFFTAMITPMILLVLYATFLANVYRDSFAASMPAGISVDGDLLDALVGGQLISSLLAVSCVTVSFCSNMMMVQDKVTGTRRDFTVAPVKTSTLSMAYFLSTEIVSLLICLVATGVGFVYLAYVGWYLSVLDVLCVLLDVFLLTLFGTALSSVIHFFLSTQGQISAVGTIISAGYGFICGAYMPISQFGEGLQAVLAFLPGTYATSLLRNHTLCGVFAEMEAVGIPAEAVQGMADVVDCRVFFFGEAVSEGVMYAILGISAVLLTLAFLCINLATRRARA